MAGARHVFPIALLSSLLVAFLLHFWPLRGDWGYWRPMVVFLVVIYWLMREPHQLGLGFAWFTGLALDVLADGILGQRALS
ncbi:MAG: rod shape-determining protein MreD, partial [Porticoccaceae bacterium]|nr:rod shape-determining protein MreD [Porticoccaceae bacterium]